MNLFSHIQTQTRIFQSLRKSPYDLQELQRLIYALQIEIGISNPDGIFGNDTLSKCPTLRESLIPDSEIPRNIIFILQGSLWCKGISPKGFTGIFGPFTANAIYNFQLAAGIEPDKVVYPYVLQGIMNTDGYSLKVKFFLTLEVSRQL